MFRKIDLGEPISKAEKRILAFWKKNKIFQKSVKNRPPSKQFTFYDGPPYATGLPHYGHILAGTLKDVVPRYWTMKGFRVERTAGWDCHGLPVEYEMEKELDLSGKKDIEKMGTRKFNEACRGIVLRYVKEWEKTIERMGRWVDLEGAYRTMDSWYMESIWWVFKFLWDRGLIYQGYKVLPYCPRCSTPLSNFETALGYQEQEDFGITLRFKLKENKTRGIKSGSYILAWTTTPWTLPGNFALALGPKIKYIRLKLKNNYFILAKERLTAYPDEFKKASLMKEFKGQDLEGAEYEPLFPYFKDLAKKGAFRVFLGDFVSIEDGTGVVHIAPAFGEDDYNLGKDQSLPFTDPVSEIGTFKDEIRDYSGMKVYEKTTNKKIVEDLKKKGKIFKEDTFLHSYPFCWRCDTPLIYKATPTWFIDIQSLKGNLLKNNEKINWIPKHLKEGRFRKGIEDAPDWAISRNRYWGTPLPVWKCRCGNLKVFGDIKSLEKEAGKKITDLHKHFTDRLEILCDRCRGRMKRIPEVLDVWFESGVMPYAQHHYPFENKKKVEKNFPADFIAEGLDQTRGWFYTLHVLATALTQEDIGLGKDRPAYKNVLTNGIILAENGQKMSKRLKNYPDPELVFEKYGADALRFYLLSSPVVEGENLCFSERGVSEILRKIILTLKASVSFFTTYANIEDWHPRQIKKVEFKKAPLLDRWILSCLNSLILEFKKSMDAYNLLKSTRLLADFLEDLSNWYIRRSRRRFSRLGSPQDKNYAFSTLYKVLLDYNYLLASFMPFIAEEIYQILRGEVFPTSEESVHLGRLPEVNRSLIDSSLQEKMEKARKICELGLSERIKVGIKVRQPLAKGTYGGRKLSPELEEIIKEELNLRKLNYKKGPSAIKLEVKIPPHLLEEGISRELIRQIQTLRKKANLSFADKIESYIAADRPKIIKAAKNFEDFIKKETLSSKINYKKGKAPYSSEINLAGSKVYLAIKK